MIGDISVRAYAPLLATLSVFGLLLSASSVVASGTLTTIQISGESTSVSDINDSGVAIGSYGGGPATGFLRTPDGTVTSFNVSGAVDTDPSGINSSGVIVGQYTDPNTGYWQPFMRNTDGTIVTFPISGSVDTESIVINDSGTIAGHYYDSSNTPHIFVRSTDGTISTYDISVAWAIWLYGINSGGSIVGFYDDHSSDPVHGFLMSPDGTITTIDAPNNGGETVLTSINDNGVIGGWTYESGGFVLETDGTFETITCSGAGTGCAVYGINNNETIAGYGYVAAKNTYVGFSQTSTGRTKTFHPPHERYGVWPEKINASGWVAGWYWVKIPRGSASAPHGLMPLGFIWTP